MNKLQKYIVKNWDSLPKSSFDDTDVVIFDTVEDYDGGWGHHGYEGYGCLQNGDIVVATSSGCSCNGSCDVSGLSFDVNSESSLKFDNYNPLGIDFSGQEVSFTSY